MKFNCQRNGFVRVKVLYMEHAPAYPEPQDKWRSHLRKVVQNLALEGKNAMPLEPLTPTKRKQLNKNA